MATTNTNDKLRLVRRVAWVAVAIAAVAAAAIALGQLQQSARQGTDLPGAARIGGDFELTAHTGDKFSSKSLAGKPHMVFFGFTHCPDICPTTLLEVSNDLSDLGPDADKLKVLFITVDPARDTVEQLKSYMSAFDPRILGLTGTTKEIAHVARLYRAFYQRVDSKDDDGDYTMNHTASIYLMDANGNLASTLTHEENPQIRAKKLRRLLQKKG